jgi:hypothetical protein
MLSRARTITSPDAKTSRRYVIGATDGTIGHVKDFYIR